MITRVYFPRAFVRVSYAWSREWGLLEEEHSAMLSVQRMGNRDLTSAEVKATHLRKTRKAAIRDELRLAHDRWLHVGCTLLDSTSA